MHLSIIYLIPYRLFKIFGGFLLFLLPLHLFCQLTVTVDNDYHRYLLGDTITFSVQSTNLDTVDFSISRNRYLDDLADGSLILQANSPQEIIFIPSEPGNYFCTVQHGENNAMAGAVCDIQGITPIEPIPSDFELYWDNIRTQLDAVPFNLNVVPDSNYLSDYSTTYRISLGNIDQHRVYGYMTIPKTNGPFTGLIKFPPFGNSSAVQPDLSMSERLGAIVISISAHNSPVNVDLPQEQQYVPDIGLTDTVFYRWAMAGGMRAIDYIYSRADFDGEHIGVFGNSQGAGLALLFAGIDDRVDLLAVNNPILSQHNGLPNNKPSGFPTYIRDHLNDPINLNRILNAVKYYDAVNAAQKFDGPALFSVSLLDEVSPAETTYCSLNQLKGKVIHIHNLEGHHSESSDEFWTGKFDLIRRFFPTEHSSWPWSQSTTGYIADAGSDTTVNCLSANIQGTIDVNGIINPSAIPVHWELVSGPGTITFDTPNNYSTLVNFSEPGEYLLRFVGEETAHLLTTSVYQTIQDMVKITACPNNNCQPLTISTPAQDQTTDCDHFSSSLSQWLANHGNATATGSASNVLWSHDFTQLPDGCNPSTLVTFMATDACGLQDSTTATFTILDTLPPTFLAQAKDTTVYCDGTGNLSDLNQWLAQNAGADASDNCGNITWSNNFSSLGAGCNPSTLVTFMATDACGLQDSTTATFTILDTLPPTFLAQAKDTTVYCDGTGNLSDLNQWLAQNAGADASDNCGNITWSNDYTTLSNDCPQTATVNFIATDECGLTHSSTATFMILDTLPPTFTTLPDTLHIECNTNGNYPEVIQWLNIFGGAVATDNCSNLSWSNDFDMIDCNDSIQIVHFMATDACNNTTATSGIISVTNTIATRQPIDHQDFIFLSTHPNPFTDKTELSFALSKPSELTITFYDMQGVVLQQIHQLFPNGSNTIQFTKAHFYHSGIIYYQIEGASIYHVGKLIRIEK